MLKYRLQRLCLGHFPTSYPKNIALCVTLMGYHFVPHKMKVYLNNNMVHIETPINVYIDFSPRNKTKNVPNLLNDERILSGFGYDRVRRSIRYPVLISTKPSTVSNVERDAKRFLNVHEFLIHSMDSQKRNFEAGIYTTSDKFVIDFAMNFGEDDVNIGVSQAYYHTHQTDIASWDPIEEFQEVIEKLPQWDPNNPITRSYYNNIIHFWGTGNNNVSQVLTTIRCCNSSHSWWYRLSTNCN
jgi:hypothetical protein